MKLYAGIDLHANNSVVVVIDEADRILYQKRLRNELTELIQELPPYQEMLQGIVVESTYNWYWLVDGLMAAGYRVHLANTTALEQYKGLKHMMSRMRGGWRRCCDWGVCPKATSIRRKNVRSGICCVSAAKWCANGRPIC
jgi:hypothetical protein